MEEMYIKFNKAMHVYIKKEAVSEFSVFYLI